MSRRITEANWFTVCFTVGKGVEQRYECHARDRDDALGQLKKLLTGKDWRGNDIGPLTVLRIVPKRLGRVGLPND